jgi:type IV secretory pathway VirD2 relaxase
LRVIKVDGEVDDDVCFYKPLLAHIMHSLKKTRKADMSVETKIKEQLLKEMYTNIDKLYDFMEQHYVLNDDHHNLLIKQLNKLKDQFYLISQNSKLS